MKKSKLLLCLSAAVMLAACRPILSPISETTEVTSSGEASTSSSSSTESSSEETTSTSSSSEPASSSEETSSSSSESSSEEEIPEVDIYDYSVTNKESTINLSKYLKDNFTKNESNYYDGEFVKKMEIEDKPIIHTHEELVDLLNKLAFYKVSTKGFRIDMTTSHGLTTKEELYLAYHDAYMCKDIVSIMSIVNDKEVGLVLNYHDEVNSFSTIKANKRNGMYATYPYLYNYDESIPKTRISDIPYHGSTDLDVHNSDQLLYAVLNGYHPVLKEGSPAKVIYDKAKNILKEIIYEDMTDNDKLLAISSYLSNNVMRDEEMDDICSYVSTSHNNDHAESTRLFRSFFIEGALLDGSATSHALSKASALLAGLLNIDVTLTGGKRHNGIKDSISPLYYEDEDRNYFDSYMTCIVKSEDKYGIFDPYYMYAGVAATATDNTKKLYRRREMMVNNGNLTTYFDVYNNELDLSFFTYHEQSEFVSEDAYHSYLHTLLTNGGDIYYDQEASEIMEDDYAYIDDTIARYKEEFNITEKRYYYVPFYTYLDTATLTPYEVNQEIVYMKDVYDDRYPLDEAIDVYPLYITDVNDINEFGFVTVLYR